VPINGISFTAIEVKIIKSADAASALFMWGEGDSDSRVSGIFSVDHSGLPMGIRGNARGT